MEKQLKYLRGERTPKDILSDLCTSFETSYPEFMDRRNNRKSTEQDSLITQAFCMIMKNNTLLTNNDIGKIINRSRGQVTNSIQKAKLLLEAEHSYAKIFQKNIAKSCPEGLSLFL